MDVDGVKAIFLLQPEVLTSQKRLTDSERMMLQDELTMPGRTYCFQRLFPEISARMTVEAQRQGFAFVDLSDAFDESLEQTFSDDAHMTPEGNRIISEQLFWILKDIFADKTDITGAL